MSEPKAIDPKLSTTDRVVKGKRRAAVARVHRVPQAPAARLPSPRSGFSPGSSHGPSRILCNPRTPSLARPPLRLPTRPHLGHFYLTGASVGKWLSRGEAVAGLAVAVAGGGARGVVAGRV